METNVFVAALGVIFAMCIGISAPILGSLITGKTNYKKLKYELYFTNRLEAYNELIGVLERIVYAINADANTTAIDPHELLSAIQRNAKLLSTDSIINKINATIRSLYNCIDKSFRLDAFTEYSQILSLLVREMRETLTYDPNSKRFNKYFHKPIMASNKISPITIRILECASYFGLNDQDICRIINAKKNKVNKWRKGRSKPTAEEVALIAGYLGVTSDYLLGLSNVSDTNTTSTL